MEEKPKKGKRGRKAKKEEDLDEDILPETGLTTPDGFLFYHTQPMVLTKNQSKRARDHGINLTAERSFTLEESVLIFNNWKEFAEEHKLKLTKAAEYINAKKADRLLVLHQKDHHFWPKLCSGLPHRTCFSVKSRAMTMMTDSFLKELNWEDPAPQIAEKYYIVNSTPDSLMWAKTKKLMDKGYSATHVAEILDIPANKARAIRQKLSRLEERNDPAMVQMVFESACSSGLDVDRIQRLLSSGDEEKYYRKSMKHVNFEEMSLKIHLSEEQCKQFLKEKILKEMWKKYEKFVEDGMENEEEAMEEVMGIVSPKEALTKEQELKALEIICQNIKKNEKLADVKGRKDLAEILRKNGITGFQCNETEYERLCILLFRATKSINEKLFGNLRRDFRFQLKCHCVLWGWKKLEVWKSLTVGKDESRYDAVLRHELDSPFVSELTKRFLKNEHVVKWINETSWKTLPQRHDHRTNVTFLAVEAFILYAHKKFKGEFKFPAKLRHLVNSRASGAIQNILNSSEDSEFDNSEFLTQKEVKKTVESAAEVKVKLRKKAFFVKKEVEEDSDDEEEEEDVEMNEEDVEERMKEVKRRKVEEMKRAIEETIQKADPMKRKKKYRLLDEEGADKQIKLRKELMQQKKILNKAVKMRDLRKGTKKFTSREFLSSESDSEEDDDEKKKTLDSEDVRQNSASEDVSSLENGKIEKRKRIEAPKDPEDVEKNLEDVPSTSKSRRKHSKIERLDSDDVEEQENRRVENSGDSEDVGKKKQRRRRQDPEDVKVSVKKERRRQNSNNSEVVESPEDVKKQKKNKGRLQNSEDSEVVENSEDVPEASEAPIDSEDVGIKKRRRQDPGDSEGVKVRVKKERRRQDFVDSEAVQSPEDVPDASEAPDDSEGVGKQKKKNKERRQDPEDVKVSVKKERRRQDSEAVQSSEDVPEVTEAPDDSEDVENQKKKKKRRRQDSEDVPNVSEAPDAPEDVESSKNSKKKKKKTSEF